ncbi:DUF3042 family protein, partial [Salmonella sp. ZJJH21_0028]
FCFFAKIYYIISKGEFTMAKGFGKGFLTGILSTVALAAGAVFTVHKTIIEPEEKKEAFIEENRKKAARKRVAH